MLKDLERIVDECDSAGGSGETLEVELRQTAQHLWRSQFLYQSDFGSKSSYDLLLQHRAYFANLFGAFGYRIVGGRPNDRFLGLLAIDRPARQTMKLDESLLLLVFRLYYEEAFKRFEISDEGEIEVDSETILQVYEDRTHRVRPPVTRLHEILTSFRQRGLLRVEDQGDSRNFTLFLRPALPIVIDEEALLSLDEFVTQSSGSRNGSSAEPTNEPGAQA
jgi:hypothetical protein